MISHRPRRPRWTHWGLGALSGLALAGAAQARLGETRAECAQRYGTAGEPTRSMVPGSEPEALRFVRKQLEITAHFKNGVAWHMTYARAYLSDNEKAAVLEENSGDLEWQPRLGEKVGNIRLWRCPALDYAASAIEGPGLMLIEIMTRACAQEIASQRELRLATVGEKR